MSMLNIPLAKPRKNAPPPVALTVPPDAERRPSDAGTIESGGENKRRSANLMSGLKRVSGKLSAAVMSPFTSSSGSKARTKEASAPALPPKIAAAPPVPPKVSSQRESSLTDSAAPLEDQHTNKEGRKSIMRNAIRRMSFNSKTAPGRAVFDIRNGLKGIMTANKQKKAAADDEENQNSDLITTPRFNDLPSLMDFADTAAAWDDYEANASIIDDRNPRINPSTIIVTSFGEGSVQSGLASAEEGPDYVYPCLKGTPQSFHVRVDLDDVKNPPVKFGDAAASRRGVYALEWINDSENGPPKREVMGEMLAYNSSHCLRRALKQDAVILPVNVDMDPKRALDLACVLFDRVGARAVRMVSEEKVALQYVTKEEFPTGIVVDIGHSRTRVVAMVDGEIAEVSLQRTMACGKTMTLRMFNLLKQRTCIFEQTITGMEFAREAKEKHAFALAEAPCSEDLKESPRNLERSFELTDGQCVLLGHERYICAEALFHPEKDEGKLSYLKAVSIQQAIVDCLKQMDRELWSALLSNVVIIGGGAHLPGLKDRLERELRDLVRSPVMRNLKISVEPYAGWKGARLAALKEGATEEAKWISRREWRQQGESAVSERLKDMRA